MFGGFLLNSGGGGGNRTRVRKSPGRNIYVRSCGSVLAFVVAPQQAVHDRQPSQVSPQDGRRINRLSRLNDVSIPKERELQGETGSVFSYAAIAYE